MLNQRLGSLFSSYFQKKAAELKLANYLSKILEIIFLKFLVYPLHAHIPPIKRNCFLREANYSVGASAANAFQDI